MKTIEEIKNNYQQYLDGLSAKSEGPIPMISREYALEACLSSFANGQLLRQTCCCPVSRMNVCEGAGINFSAFKKAIYLQVLDLKHAKEFINELEDKADELGIEIPKLPDDTPEST